MADDWLEWRYDHGVGNPPTRFVFKNVRTKQEKIFTRNTVPAELESQLPRKVYPTR